MSPSRPAHTEAALRAARWLFSAIAIAGCAKGDPIAVGGGGVGGSGDGGSTGNIGPGAGPGSGSGSSGPGSSTSSGPPCDESPCKLVSPQCGCSAGEACTIDGMGGRVCIAEGAAGQGDLCSDAGGCIAGAACLGYPGLDSTCATYCASNADCSGPGSLCVVSLADQPDALFCTDACDPLSGQGCLVFGTGCQIGATDAGEAYTVCVPSGSGVDNEVCTSTSDCSVGYTCWPTTANDDRCFEWCEIGGAPCSNMGTCTALEITTGVPLVVGDITYGLCNPPG